MSDRHEIKIGDEIRLDIPGVVDHLPVPAVYLGVTERRITSPRTGELLWTEQRASVRCLKPIEFRYHPTTPAGKTFRVCFDQCFPTHAVHLREGYGVQVNGSWVIAGREFDW